MYLGNIKNLSDTINLSETTINRLSDFEFVKKCFEDNFNDLLLNIKNEKHFINFNYNIYTKEITFANDSINIDKDTIYYKKLKKYMNQLSDRLSDRDDFLSVVNEQRQNFIDILSNLK